MNDLVIVRGGNDIASAVAHRLFIAGYPVMILEVAQPATVRRAMAYASAVYEGKITLHDVTAEYAPTPDRARAILDSRAAIPVVTTAEGPVESAIRPNVIVDARYRKKERSTSRTTDAPLVIGLGPGFTAGVEAHLVIETNRGPNLGRIITAGEAEPYTGEPLAIEGHSKERLLYAPQAGIFRTGLEIGSRVTAGQVVGVVDGTPLVARVDGIVRGIVRDGLRVPAGAKLVDIDPRGDPTLLARFSEKAWVIADAVLAAIRTRTPHLIEGRHAG
jgi:xanthine dehydrogenase accessory factor